MNKVLRFLEENQLKDPVIFSWNSMRNKGKIDDELAVINLIQALVSNKNMALRALDSIKNKNKVVELRRDTKR